MVSNVYETKTRYQDQHPSTSGYIMLNVHQTYKFILKHDSRFIRLNWTHKTSRTSSDDKKLPVGWASSNRKLLWSSECRSGTAESRCVPTLHSGPQRMHAGLGSVLRQAAKTGISASDHTHECTWCFGKCIITSIFYHKLIAIILHNMDSSLCAFRALILCLGFSNGSCPVTILLMQFQKDFWGSFGWV